MRQAIRALVAGVCLLGGFALTCFLLAKALPNLDRGPVRDKLLRFARERDSYDTLFFGTSRVYHHISPEIYDQVTGAHGRPTHSFNFGMDALFPPEDSYLAEQIFALKPTKLRWVFIEVSMFQPIFAEESPETPRSTYWHDWKRTYLTCRDIFEQLGKVKIKKYRQKAPEWQEAASRALLHVQLLARNETNLGKGSEQLAYLLGTRVAKAAAQYGIRVDTGYAPLRRSLAADSVGLEKYRRDLKERLNKAPSRQVHRYAGRECLASIVQLVKQSGATPILFIAPAVGPIVFLPGEDIEAPMLDFTDANSWPDLFREEYRADYGHLNPEGAEVFSRTLAKRWLELQAPGATQAALPASGLDARASTP